MVLQCRPVRSSFVLCAFLCLLCRLIHWRHWHISKWHSWRQVSPFLAADGMPRLARKSVLFGTVYHQQMKTWFPRYVACVRCCRESVWDVLVFHPMGKHCSISRRDIWRLGVSSVHPVQSETCYFLCNFLIRLEDSVHYSWIGNCIVLSLEANPLFVFVALWWICITQILVIVLWQCQKYWFNTSRF